MKKKILVLIALIFVSSLAAGKLEEGDTPGIMVAEKAARMVIQAKTSEAINISQSGGTSQYPHIVTDEAGAAHAIWVHFGAGRSIQFNSNEGGAWGKPYSMSAGTTIGHSGPWPSFTADNNGIPHIVYTAKFSGGNYEIAHNSYYGQWNNLENVSRTYEGGSACPTIAVNPVSNQRYVCWYDDENYPDRWELFFKVQNGSGSWSGLKILPFSTSCYTPKMAVDGRGTGHLIWLRRRRGGSFVHYASNANPQDEHKWTSDQDLSGNTHIDFSEINIAADRSGNVFVVWEQNNNGNWEIMFRKKTAAGGWLTAENISKTGNASRWPDIAVDDDGNAYVVWQERHAGRWQVFFKFCQDGAWTSSSDVTNNNSDSIHPSIWLDGSGEIHLVYADNQTGNYNIFYISTTDPGTPVYALYPPLNVHMNTVLEDSSSKKNIVLWKKNPDNDNETLQSYKIYRKQATHGVNSYKVRATVPKGTTRFEDGGLSTGYKYSYVVTSIDNEGIESDFSNETSEPLVFPPVNLAMESSLNASQTKKINTLTWGHNPNNGKNVLERYRVYRRETGKNKFVALALVGGSVKTYADKNLPTGKKFVYRLTAMDRDGRECEPSASVFEAYVFHPISLNLTTVVNEGLYFSEKINRLKWKRCPLNDPVSVVKFVVYRKKAGQSRSAFAPFHVVEDAATLEFWDRSLPLDEKYSYAVTAVCANGAESELSAQRTEN